FDQFDQELYQLSLTYDQGLPGNKTVEYPAQTVYNKFLDNDVTLANKNLKDLKITWNPKRIIFEDGSIEE
ncbi:MAG TPA: hypothetical protein VIK89_00605, partial [Cytophagaceae bacterium]